MDWEIVGGFSSCQEGTPPTRDDDRQIGGAGGEARTVERAKKLRRRGNLAKR